MASEPKDEPLFPTAYTITVERLLAMLKGYLPDTPIVMSKDGEGNGFSPLSDIGMHHYRAETTWSGECDGDDGVPVVCLWPVN